MTDGNDSRLARRDLLKRGALVGGAVLWTTPVVQSIGGTALATGGSAGGQAPSYTLIVLKCGTNSYTRVVIGQDGKAECGGNIGNGPSQTHAVRMIDEQLAAFGKTWAGLSGTHCLPTFTSAVVPAGLRIGHPGCTVVAWSVHDGASNGCGQVSFGPTNRGLPAYNPTINNNSMSVFPKPKVTTCPTPPPTPPKKKK